MGARVIGSNKAPTFRNKKMLCINLIQRFVKNQENIMQGLDDLKVNVASLVSKVEQVKASVADLNTKIAALNAIIAAGGDNDDEVEAQAKAIADQVAVLSGIVNPTA